MSAALPPEVLADGSCMTGDPERMFPDPRNATGVAAAQRVCAGCPARAECAEWAVSTDQRHGVWGGLSEDDRAALRGRRLAVSAA